MELGLIIRLSSLSLDILLYGIYLRLVDDELLFNFIELVVDLILKNKILFSIVTHCVVSGLLGETMFILLDKFLDDNKSCFLLLESSFKLICLCKLVCHFIFHFLDLLAVLFHFFVNARKRILANYDSCNQESLAFTSQLESCGF